MAFSFNGSDQCVKADSAAVTAVPMTFSAFFNPDNITSSLSIIVLSDKNSNQVSYALLAAGAIVKDPVRAQHGNEFTASTTTGFIAEAWQHAAGSFEASNARSVFLNGGNKGENTSNTSAYLPNVTNIGRIERAVNSPHFFDGFLSEAAIWNVVLTDSEIASLAKGFSPRRIRPQSLVFYAPLLRNLQDLRKGLALTAVNSPTVAAHPRVY